MKAGGYKEVDTVPQAPVPIGEQRILGFIVKSLKAIPLVKFRDPATGLLFDLNVNERLGLHNSLLLNEYCDLLPELRPLIYLIKKWAKSHGLNNPSIRNESVSFSSYALALMTIGHLQVSGVYILLRCTR